MLFQTFLYQAPVQYNQKPLFPWIGEKSILATKRFHTSKTEGSMLFFLGQIQYFCVAQSQIMFEKQGLKTDVKKVSALINDWENNIAYLLGRNQAKQCLGWQV